MAEQTKQAFYMSERFWITLVVIVALTTLVSLNKLNLSGELLTGLLVGSGAGGVASYLRKGKELKGEASGPPLSGKAGAQRGQ